MSERFRGDFDPENEESKLRGTLVKKSKLSGTLIEKQKKSEQAEFALEIGTTIEVRDLKIQTPVSSEVYSGKLTVTGIQEKGTPSSLKMKGKTIGTDLPERYYNFKYSSGSIELTCTAPESRVKASLVK